MTNILGWQNLYHPDHKNKRMFVRMYKVASTSLLHSAFNNGWASMTPEQAQKYIDYYLIAFVRDPIQRNISWYKDGHRWMGYEAYVDKVLADQFENNPHCLPQSKLLIRKPDFLGRFESLSRDYERLQEVIGKRWPLQRRNPANDDIPWQEHFFSLPKEKQDALIAFYKEDYDNFKYGRPN